MTVDPTNPPPPPCLTCRHYVPGDRPRCALTVWFFAKCGKREERDGD